MVVNLNARLKISILLKNDVKFSWNWVQTPFQHHLSFDRKLGAKRSHSEETNESHFADDNDTQVKTSKKISRLSKEDNSTEREMSAEEDNTGSVTKDMDMLEDNKSDIDEGASPQNIAEQGTYRFYLHQQ